MAVATDVVAITANVVTIATNEDGIADRIGSD